MLKYLRKLRKTLLLEGNLKKYLSYAIGEIIIVVAGILLALYLNNWNQERANDKLEIKYYQNIKFQLNEDLNTLTDVMDYNQNYLTQFIYAKKLIVAGDRSKTDTLGKIALNMIRYSDFRRKSNLYQTMVNSGEIIILNNYKITDRLQSLEENYTYINRLEASHEAIIISQIINDIRQILRFDPMKVINPDSLFSYRFQNSFDILMVLMIEKREAYSHAVNEINLTVKLIDQELTN
jgi:hypothetical protein